MWLHSSPQCRLRDRNASGGYGLVRFVKWAWTNLRSEASLPSIQAGQMQPVYVQSFDACLQFSPRRRSKKIHGSLLPSGETRVNRINAV